MTSKPGHEQKLDTRTFAAGEVLFKEGDPGGDVYIVRSGQLEVFRSRVGREWVLARPGKDEIIGAMTVTSGAPRTASVRAVEQSSVIVIARAQIEGMLSVMPKWGHAIIKDLTARVHAADELFIEAASSKLEGTPDDPIALSCLVASALPSILKLMTGPNPQIDIKELYKKIAEVLDVETEQVIFVIEKFMEAGLLTAKDAGKEVRGFEGSSIVSLKHYIKFVKQLRERTKSKDFLPPLLSIGERTQASALAESAQTLTKKPGEDSEFNLQALLTLIHKTHDQVDQTLVKRLVALGYVKFKETETDAKKAGVAEPNLTTLVFAPQLLTTIMHCYQAIKLIDHRALADTKVQKTLSY